MQPARWHRLKESYLRPELQFCPTCGEFRLWSRDCCQVCQGGLRMPVQSDAVFVSEKRQREKDEEARRIAEVEEQTLEAPACLAVLEQICN